MSPDSVEAFKALRSHLTDVVVDGVGVSVGRGIERSVFVRVDLRHGHVHAVRVVVRRSSSIGRDSLWRKQPHAR